MSDPSDDAESADASDDERQGAVSDAGDAQREAPADGEAGGEDVEGDIETLRERVEQEYDFDDFGPQEMAEMSPEEWAAVFDEDAWVTGEELLDRVEADLRSRIADRDVFAVVERTVEADERLVAYSDRSYAVVYPDGSIEGEGAVLRDVKPTVALASMPDYEVPDPPDGSGLPTPEAVDEGSSRLGNWMLQFVAGAMALAGLVLLGGGLLGQLGSATIVAVTIGLVFLLVGGALLFAVANARLSSRYRAEEYRSRLRGAGVGGERPDFLPVDETAFPGGPELEPGEQSDGTGSEPEAGSDAPASDGAEPTPDGGGE